jgi:hypothetical protein
MSGVLGTCNLDNLLILLVRGCSLERPLYGVGGADGVVLLQLYARATVLPPPTQSRRPRAHGCKGNQLVEVGNVTSVLLSPKSTMELILRGVDAS